MMKIEAQSPEAQSADLIGDNIAKLKALFPELLTETAQGAAINVDVLKALVGDASAFDGEEKYGLNWHGKRRARQIALTPSTGTLRPCPEESVDWDSTQNLMIEGDNLEVLKLLQKSYAGKVKLIYIDPPYNTGKDFVYPDNFQDNIKNYLELTGQTEGGAKITTNTEASGRFHTDWLNMIYPRLKLAHSLLQSDGVIFVSIADHEIHNLRAVMNEVFGEENFVATVIWQKVYSPKNSARHFSEDHDYIVVYAKNAETWVPRLLPRTKEMEARYANSDNDPRGPWKAGDLSARNSYGEGTYPITTPSGRQLSGPPPGSYWRVSRSKFDQLDADKRIWWGPDGNNVPAIKRFLSEVRDGRVPQTLWTYEEVGHTQDAKKELIATVDFPNSDVIFDTPKPTRLLRRILQLATSPENNDLVLDFFAGTGSMMDAVYQQNAKDGGKRRCIVVQLPEPLVGGEVVGWTSIADITRARLVGAGKRCREADPMFSGDVGFRTFKLDTSNIRAWNPNASDLEGSLLANLEHIEHGRSESDVLYEVLIKLGLDLCVPIEQREIAGKGVHNIGGGTLMACLGGKIAVADAEPLALGIAAWREEQGTAGDTTVVFCDSAFENDVAKSNLAAILEQHGIKQLRSL
ncbi:site-specific DNA-methyltransferase [Verminephrobacter aporrectodeae]|uniref:site-specific DNA-methyltransferase n=1 Tax=Verminephrobacter aporrectodeae TaxID=1110389 RepID=UPI00224337B0|nr:site-specific DNA-methyltransferase [Verminephrobacter aporrectodeae]MCW8175550.1 site-specific DNA-methyltransferase [Verminephrobacter aporrectodeae subsp. tuberculatae]MCW8203133.1 site-specific DNA-methyltransferase [Verminephrobacter aporrectodeae subsp. tuberculatae]